MMRAILPLPLLTLLACSPPTDSVGAHERGLNGGAPENGFAATVFLSYFDWEMGGMCSGSLIAPRVVVSAKHCFDQRMDTSKWSVSTGPFGDRPSDIYEVDEVLTTPGEQVDNFDIAIVIVSQDVDVEPYPLRRDLGGIRPGDSVSLIGYGESPDGGYARKYSGDAELGLYGPYDEARLGENEFLTYGAAACGGDSGGTVIDAEGELIGVIVRGPAQDCGNPDNNVTMNTRVDRFLDLIDEGLQSTGVCVPSGTEICDGLDNDCDDVVDPGCEPFLAPCSSDDGCLSGLCRDLGDGPICTEQCEIVDPLGSCPEGTYCSQLDCEQAFCAPGEPGGSRIGDTCEGDADCSSLFCRGGTCRSACRSDMGQCGPGEACATQDRVCGACQPAADVQGERGLGEPCGSNADCRSGACANLPGDRYCTSECDGQCPTGYHCSRGACLRGQPGQVGEPCVASDECAEVCIQWSDPAVQACSAACDRSRACPSGSSCVEVEEIGQACRPNLAILGAACEQADDCMSGICTGSRCSRRCGAQDPCATGFECRDYADGNLLCAPLEDESSSDDSSGCLMARGAPATSEGLWLLSVLAVVLRAARRGFRDRRPRRVSWASE